MRFLLVFRGNLCELVCSIDTLGLNTDFSITVDFFKLLTQLRRPMWCNLHSEWISIWLTELIFIWLTEWIFTWLTEWIFTWLTKWIFIWLTSVSHDLFIQYSLLVNIQSFASHFVSVLCWTIVSIVSLCQSDITVEKLRLQNDHRT